MSTRHDYATPARRAFCRLTRPSARYGWALAAALALTGLEVDAACVTALELGVSAHVSGWSAPDYTTPNPLGVVELRRECGPWVFSVSHTSSLQGFPHVFDSPGEDGYGINQASVRYRLSW